MDFSATRPLWEFAADELIALNVDSKSKDVVDKDMRTSVFLQAWNSGRTLKPKDLVDMLRVAKARGVQMDRLAFSREIMREAPIWYHVKLTAR
jgi:hypothetical protein